MIMKEKPQAKQPAQENENARPTITLRNIIVTGPDTSAFSGWGPRVAGSSTLLKNWN
jgi:hypothetical protein